MHVYQLIHVLQSHKIDVTMTLLFEIVSMRLGDGYLPTSPHWPVTEQEASPGVLAREARFQSLRALEAVGLDPSSLAEVKRNKGRE